MTEIDLAVMKVIYDMLPFTYILYRYIKLARYSHCLFNDPCAILLHKT